jgi:hypothetical protein
MKNVPRFFYVPYTPSRTEDARSRPDGQRSRERQGISKLMNMVMRTLVSYGAPATGKL